MKKQQMTKAKRKLQLSKETILNLENGALTAILGGGGGTGGGSTALETLCNTFCSCPDTK
jgi:ABC-type hemin transport system ATPase subunit